MPGRNFSGLTPIENSGVNQHMPFAQKIFSDEKAFWNVDEWDLPAGAEMRENQNRDQATVLLKFLPLSKTERIKKTLP